MDDKREHDSGNRWELWVTLLLSVSMIGSAFVSEAFFPSRGGLSREDSPELFYSATAAFALLALFAVFRLARSGGDPEGYPEVDLQADTAQPAYRVEIIGLAEGTDSAQATRRLAALTKVDEKRAARALGALPISIARRVDAERAGRFRDVLTRNGFQPRISELAEGPSSASPRRGKLFRVATIALGLTSLCLAALTVFLLTTEPKPEGIEVYTAELPTFAPPEDYNCKPNGTAFRDRADASNYIDYSEDLRPASEVTDLRALAGGASEVRYRHADADSHPIALHVFDQNLVSLMPRRLQVLPSDRPQWLLISGLRNSSARPSARFVIEVAPGAKLERILVDSSVAQLTLSDQSLTGSRFRRLLASMAPSTIANVQIEKLDLYKLCARRSQKRGAERRDFAIRQWAAATQTLLGTPFTTSVILKTLPVIDEVTSIPFAPFAVDRDRLQALEVAWLYKTAQADIHGYVIEKDYAVTYQERDFAAQTVALESPAAAIDMLELYAGKKLIPVAVPSEERFKGSHPDDWLPYFWHLEYPVQKVTRLGKYKCSSYGRTVAGVVLGTIQDDEVECSWGNHFHYLDWGDDTVEDSWGSDIFYGGPGDDKIDVGYGSDIVIYTAGWGTDTLDATCHNTVVTDQDLAGMNRFYWDPKWRFSKFIVFGREIRREDIVATPGRLTHKVTGDSITLVGGGKSLCFNLVFWE